MNRNSRAPTQSSSDRDHGPVCGTHARWTQSRIDQELRRSLTTIKQAGLKSTRARASVLKAAISLRAPFTVDELFRDLNERSGEDLRFDLVTLYRNLATFTELDIVRKIEFGDGVSRFEMRSESEEHHHHHFVCNICRRIEPVDSCEIEQQEARLRERGYASLTHRLEFFGVCPTCQISTTGAVDNLNGKR